MLKIAPKADPKLVIEATICLVKGIIVVALKSELLNVGNMKVIYTGIGKVNAAHYCTKCILEMQPTYILNVGTAGALRPELLGKVYEVRSVVERDMCAEPLAHRGFVPFEESSGEIILGEKGLKVGTGDSFVTSKDNWLVEQRIDLVDMELYAIAKSCSILNIPCYSIKFASDLADGDAENQWSTSMVKARETIGAKIDEKLAELEIIHG